MADKVTQTSTLQMVAEFADGDDRTINLDNPNTAINLAASVVNLGNYCKQNQVIIGDKADAKFERFKSAKIVQKNVTKFDLG